MLFSLSLSFLLEMRDWQVPDMRNLKYNNEMVCFFGCFISEKCFIFNWRMMPLVGEEEWGDICSPHFLSGEPFLQFLGNIDMTGHSFSALPLNFLFIFSKPTFIFLVISIFIACWYPHQGFKGILLVGICISINFFLST